jgi:hypothetical protein
LEAVEARGSAHRSERFHQRGVVAQTVAGLASGGGREKVAI